MTKTTAATRKDLRKFGFLFLGVGLVLAAILAYKGNHGWWWAVAAGGLFGAAGGVAPEVLRPVHTVWMRFAGILGWVNTRLLLGVFFYVILTPGAVIMRLVGRDSLHRKFDRKATTYWQERPDVAIPAERYEQLF